MAAWLVADRVLGHTLFAIGVTLGVALGILWERRSKEE